MTSRLNLAGFTQEYIVGIEELDEQHKTFFTLLDKIGKAAPDMYRPLDEDEADAVIDVLNELRDYALLHFRTEEGYMQEIDYPGLAGQKREHNRFITDVIRMERELMNGTAMPAITIRNFMHDWYRDHILNLDKPFGQAYKKIKG
ncbi:bacteriohemerythrin [Pseudodesulfovibrio sp. F-1]|uniref:Bacteriohemerythrin n=1 Tax=Pseudodesulfovibrio alkaliphilus TaxID=2661613 RepID=A0A7K1KJX2_9BACT|nr:bacteriohemerythrin [Pseudodesulfovibrio alkaliphilus]MUM76374.1 bacteriohemerythrin [Pseudodesulfovibrio alkaliphilus]